MQTITCGNTLTGSSGVNGDNFYISPTKSLLVLADGASGAGDHGKVVMSSTCVELARRFENEAPPCVEPRVYVAELFDTMNQALIEISQRERTLCFGTIVIALVYSNELLVTTYGDSPAFLFRGKNVVRVARNPKRYEDMIRDGFITREQYESYIYKMHERMWSCFDRFLPDIVPNNVIECYQISPGDIFFACSDGLSDWVEPQHILAEIQNFGLEKALGVLLPTARDLALNQRDRFDDITAVAISFDS